jgi:iron complex outermembrane receptor protein
VTTASDCLPATRPSNDLTRQKARWLIGAAFLLGDIVTGSSIAQAQSSTALPAVTVDAPTQVRRTARATGTPARRTQAATARRQNRNAAPTAPTPSERAIAAAAARYEQILGYRAMPSSTTLRGATSPLNTSQVVNVVPQQVISDQRPRNLDDALINVSGITQGNTLAGTQDAVMRRGFGDNRDGSIMRNGMPINQGRALNPAVASVEVLKGPASLLYGIMDPGGIINTISKRPELYQHGEITIEGATFGAKGGGNVTADITGPIGQDGLAYRLIAYNINEDYWRNFGTRHETLFAPSLAWYGDDTTVQLSYEHRDFSSPFDRGVALDPRTNSPLAGVPITRRFDEPYNSMWGTSELLQASVDHRINENWKLYAGYSYNSENYTANQLRISAINPVTGVLTRSNDGTGGALTQVSYGTSYMQGTVWLGGFKNEVVFGGDAEYRVIYRKDLIRQAVATQNIFNPVYDRQGPGTTVSPTDSDQTDKLGSRSVFAQDTLHLTNWLALVGGVRWMEYEQIAGRGRPFITNTNTMGDKTLPLGGVIVKLNDQVSLYASYTESLKPSWTIAPLASIITSNLAPEEGVSYEAGVKFDFNKRLSGSVAFYDLNKKNVLVSLFDAGTGTNALRAAGAARSRGVEIDVTGRLSDNWSTIATYAYTDARVTSDPLLNGNGLQNVALNTGSLFVVYDFLDTLPRGRLRLGAGARYVGDRPGDAENTFILPNYTVADAFVTYDTKHNNVPVTYQFNVKNMFDNVYFPSAVNKLNVALGDARRFSLAATVKF